MTIDTIMNPRAPRVSEAQAAFQITLTITEAIREAGEIPSGTLYAMLCGKMDLPAYEAMIRTIKNTGLVTEKNHLLTWAGPKF